MINKTNQVLNTLLIKKHRKVVLSCIFVFLCFLGLLIFEAFDSYKLTTEQTYNYGSNISKLIDAELNEMFKTVDLLLKDIQLEISPNKKITSKNSKFFNNLLASEKTFSDKILTLKIYNLEGEFVGDDSGKISSKNVRDRDYYNHFINNPEDKLYISKPMISKTLNVWIFTMSRPILDKNGKLQGIVLASVSLEKIKDQFGSLDLGNGGVSLYDTEGILYSRYPWLEEKVNKKIPERRFNEVFKNSNGDSTHFLQKSPLDGVYRFLVFKKIKNYNFYIGVSYIRDEVLFNWELKTCFKLIIFFIVSIFSAYYLANYLYKLEEVEEQKRLSLQSTKMSSLGEMASGIAHEINNPLTVITGKAHHVKKAIINEEVDKDKAIDDLNKIINTVDRIAKIINGLRSFSRESSSEKFSEKNIYDLVQSAIEICHSKITDNEVKVSIMKNSNIKIWAREIQLTQVLVNLISNAVDAVASEKEKWIKVEILDENEILRIKIVDSGHGISKEVIEKIMQPFFTTKEIGKGTGLGLSISKGIIEDHGGKLLIDRNSMNTTFIIQLPKINSNLQAA